MVKVLVVEDDQNFNRIVCNYLNANNFQATGCISAQEAYETLYNELFDLIITDVMMPGVDGIEFAKTVRQINEQIPILFVTAKDDLKTKEAGFRIGIDDYMVKPIDLEELKMRINAILRRSNIAQDKKIVVGELVMDSEALSVQLKGKEIAMTVREFNILYKLLSYPNHAFSRAQLLDEFWGVDTTTSLRSVDVYITKIREKIHETEAFKIQTIHGLGYKAVINE
ncbi:response regulator transcription factor [Liquorilactobacillus mali]|uniref:response regulator transcription factor n=1 Tax=Liquorilactobacillus mali TaxID=1618 RepID=UPI00234FEAB7|nr:response regulator transcription factor [Liquorilactobacillus mali]MDC7952833.1 response regulator transcription factor [Liquorilactobacillus mali]